MTRSVNDIATYQCGTDAFKFLFFLWTINEWNEIHIKIRNSLYSVFENYLLKEIRRQPSPSYNIHNPLNYLYTRLRLELVNRMNASSTTIWVIILILFYLHFGTESTLHFFLHCHRSNSIRSILLTYLNLVDKNLIKLSGEVNSSVWQYSIQSYAQSLFTKPLNKVH